MKDLGLTTGDLFALLILGMGPTRVSLAFLQVAPALTRDQQKTVALRTTTAGLIVVIAVTLAGGGLVRSYAPRVEMVLIGSGLVLVTVTLAGLARRPGAAGAVGPPDPATYAISPLTVPVMINPVGVSILFAYSAYVDNSSDTLVFAGLALVILAINYVALLLVPFVARAVAMPVLRLIQEIVSLLTVALGVRMILLGLDGFGVIDMT